MRKMCLSALGASCLMLACSGEGDSEEKIEAEDGCEVLDTGRLCVRSTDDDDDSSDEKGSSGKKDQAQDASDSDDDDSDDDDSDDDDSGSSDDGDSDDDDSSDDSDDDDSDDDDSDDDTGGFEELPCSFTGILRDFPRAEDAHPDFSLEHSGLTIGMVETELDDDSKPVFSGMKTKLVTSTDTFAEWYRDDTASYEVRLEFRDEDGVYKLGSKEFFPLDGLGYGNEGLEHNYGFSTELRGTFVYDPDTDAYITIDGDDDLWVFINGKLVIDLGGIHFPERDTVYLTDVADELELEPMETYEIALFHAERQPEGSIFSIETTVEFSPKCR